MFRKLTYAFAPIALLAGASTAVAATIQTTKSATCGCCDGWVDHMRKEGFDVKVTVVDDIASAGRKLGVPDRLRSCHTSVIEGYVIEGHVPAADVKRLLASKPKAVGLSVPGMVVGSPGMEVGNRKDPYQVLLFDKSGKTRVFASH